MLGRLHGHHPREGDFTTVILIQYICGPMFVNLFTGSSIVIVSRTKNIEELMPAKDLILKKDFFFFLAELQVSCVLGTEKQ